MSDYRFGVSPVNYPDPDPDPEVAYISDSRIPKQQKSTFQPEMSNLETNIV